MIIPKRERDCIRVIYCPVCRGHYWIKNDGSIACLVYHPRGSCCHYGDREISAGLLSRILEILEKDEGAKP